jgi:hypothetical protein
LQEERKKSIVELQICDEGSVWVCSISGVRQNHAVSFLKWVSFVRWKVITVGVGVPVNSIP